MPPIMGGGGGIPPANIGGGGGIPPGPKFSGGAVNPLGTGGGINDAFGMAWPGGRIPDGGARFVTATSLSSSPSAKIMGFDLSFILVGRSLNPFLIS